MDIQREKNCQLIPLSDARNFEGKRKWHSRNKSRCKILQLINQINNKTQLL